MKKLLYTSALTVLFLQPQNAIAETMNKQMAFQKALQNNPSYIAALASIDIADGERLQASLLPNPNAIIDVENFAGDDEQEGFDGAEITLGIEQTIEIGGKRKNRNDISNFNYRIVQEQAKASALSILAETEYAFVRAGIAQGRISLADKRLALAEKTHRIVKKRVGAAKAADIQHTKADIEKAAADVEKRKAEKELAIARNDLSRLLGIGSAANIDIEMDMSVLPNLPDKQNLLNALDNSPQYKAQEFAKLQSRSALSLAQSESIPDPTFGLGVRRFNENDSTALVAGLSFPLPVLNRNQGGIKQAKANIIKVDAENYAAGLSLRQSAIQAWESFAASREETDNYQNKIIPSAQKAYSQADDGYSRGAFTFLDLLDAQRTLYEVQEAQLDSLLSVYEFKAQTDFLMGTHSDLIAQHSQTQTKGQTNE